VAPRSPRAIAYAWPFGFPGGVRAARCPRPAKSNRPQPSEKPLTDKPLSKARPDPADPKRAAAVRPRPLGWSGTLRTQLLAGLAILLTIALVALAAAILLWQLLGLSADALAVALLLIIVVDIAVLVLFGDYLLRRLVLEPIGRMVERSRRIAEGDHEVRLDVGGADELRSLSDSVNDMADRLLRHQRMLGDNIASLEETNRQLVAARAELIHAEKMASVGRLAAGIAHEIGNPLGAILGYVDVAKRRAPDGADGEWMEGVRDESKRIDRIVRGLLDYARPKAAAVKPVAVNDVVRRTLELVETQGRLKEIEVRAELAEDVPEVLADGGQLEQVLVNLLLNATDSIREAEAGGRITVRTARGRHRAPAPDIRPRRRDDPEDVDYSHLRRLREPPEAFQPSPLTVGALIARIEVEDNGVGLEPGEESRVFDPFYTTKEPGRGTGLGLAVSSRLISGMKGQITASGRGGGGAVFSISLPALETGPTQAEEAGG
jgi:signal transduction histidine kinase